MSFVRDNSSNYKSHIKAVVSLKLSEDGLLLASASADRKAMIHDTCSKQTLRTLEGQHVHGLNDCSWMGNNRMLVTASDDYSVKVWDVEQGKMLLNFRNNSSVAYSLCINPINNVIMCGLMNGSVLMYHASCRDAIAVFAAQGDPVVSIDMKMAADGRREFMTAGQEGVVRLWDIANIGMCCKSIVAIYNPHKSTSLASATYSPNAQYVLTSCFNSEHRLIPLHKKSFHSDSGEGGVVVDNKLHVYRGHVNQRFSVQSRIYSSAAFGSFILSGSEDGKVYMWDLQSKKVACKVEAHEGPVLTSVMSPDRVVSTDSEGRASCQMTSAGTDGHIKGWRYVEPMKMDDQPMS